MMEQKPVASVHELIGQYWDIGYREGKEGVSHGTEAQILLSRINDALADQLKAEREKAIREAASVAYGFHDCDAIAEEILALLSNNEKEPE